MLKKYVTDRLTTAEIAELASARLTEADVLKLVNRTLSKPPQFTGMQVVAVDDEGRQYLSMADGMAMSVERMAKMRQYYQLLTEGLSPGQIREAINVAVDHMNDGNTVKAGAVMVMMLEKFDNVVNTELFVNIVAVQLIRSDEDVLTFNDAIHKEKVAWLTYQSASSGFFFRLKEWKTLSDQFKISAEQFTELSTVFQEALRNLANTLKQIRSLD